MSEFKAEGYLICFRLAGQEYALPLARVERALRMMAIAPVPETPSWVLGAINVHGRVMPAVDLRQPLGLPAAQPRLSDRLMLVRVGKRTAALMVNEMTRVRAVSHGQVEPIAEPFSRSRPLAGFVRDEAGLTLLLDPDRLLPTEVDPWDLLAAQRDDLTEIEGIGPVYDARLKALGIDSVATLADCDADEVAALLDLSGGRAESVRGWIQQAKTLRDGKKEGAAPTHG